MPSGPILKTILFTILAPGSVLVLVPCWILDGFPRPDSSPRKWLGVLTMLWGSAIYFRSPGVRRPWTRHSRAHRSHEISGHRPPSTGTSATPVYIGVFAVLLGEAATLHSMRLLGYAAFLCIPVQLFVIYDEQPTLRRQFGDSYEPYRRSVPRWIPRL